MSIPWDKIPIFAGLQPKAIEFLTEKARDLTVPVSDTIIREGETGNRMFVIRSGEVRVWKGKKDGTQFEVARLKAGDFFGEMCILETLPRTATVEATVDTVLCSLSSITFYQFYQSMPDQYSILVLNIARDLSRRLRRLDNVFAAMS
jgi:CRP/FNR family transcriptional regulator, cyclic AMP receptor protein